MDNFNNYIPEGNNDNPTTYDPNTSGLEYGGQEYTPEYTSPGFVQPDYEQPSYTQPDYMQPDYTQPGYIQPDYGQTDYSTQDYAEQGYETSNFEEIEYKETDSSDISSTNSSDSDSSISDSLYAPLYPEGYAPSKEPQSAIQRNPEDEELTEAELADIRRQKAAARRRKMAARERKRRERRKQAIIRCSILLAIVILLIAGLVMLISGIVNSAKEKKKARELSEYYATSEVTTEDPVADIDEDIVAKELPTDRDAALAILQEQAAEDSTMQSICDSAAAMPDILLQYLAVNPELKDFTLSYPAMINIVFDGEFELEVEKGEVPLYLQYDERWGYADYSKDIIALRGAGPTALSMAYTYLMSDGSKNPIKIADYATEMGYLNEDGKTHWSLMTTGAEAIGLKSTEIDTNKEDMIKALEDGNVLICKVKDGDFTTEESFILIHDYKKGFFYLKDPCSEARSKVGWDFKRLRGQIDKIAILAAGAQDTSTEAVENDASTAESSESSNLEGGNETGDESTPAE